MYNVITKEQVKSLQRKAAGSSLNMLDPVYEPGHVELTFEYNENSLHCTRKIVDLFSDVGVEIDSDSMLDGQAARSNTRHPGSYATCNQGKWARVYRLILLNDSTKIGKDPQLILKFLCPCCKDEDAVLVHCAVVRSSLNLTGELAVDADTSMYSYIDYENSTLAKSIMYNKPYVDESECYEVAMEAPQHFECSHCGADWSDLSSLRRAGGFILSTITNLTDEDAKSI